MPLYNSVDPVFVGGVVPPAAIAAVCVPVPDKDERAVPSVAGTVVQLVPL